MTSVGAHDELVYVRKEKWLVVIDHEVVPRIELAIRQQSGRGATRGARKAREETADQDLAVRFQRHGCRRKVWPRTRIETLIELAPRIEPCEVIPCHSVDVCKIADD